MTTSAPETRTIPYSDWLPWRIRFLGSENRAARWRGREKGGSLRHEGTAKRQARYNSEVECARQRAWRDAHPRYKTEYMRAWYARNPGYYMDYYVHAILPRRVEANKGRYAAAKAALDADMASAGLTFADLGPSLARL